jgi:hypothetical protein
MVFFGHGYKVAEMANPKIERLTRRYDNDFAEYRAPLLARRRRTPFSPDAGEAAHPGRTGWSLAGDAGRSAAAARSGADSKGVPEARWSGPWRRDLP